MAKRRVEIQAVAHGEITSYRVRENPDADLGSSPGEHGIVIDWSDNEGTDGGQWSGHFFVGQDMINPLIEALEYYKQKE